MTVNQYEIHAERETSALLRLFHSQVGPCRRPLFEHHHTMVEIALVKKGSGIYTVGERRYDIAPGDIFLFSGDEQHCITDIHGDMLLMNVHFEPRFVWASGNNMFDAKYMKVFLDRSDSFENRLDRQNPATSEITEQMLAMEREFIQHANEYDLMVKIHLLTILVLLSRSYGYVNPDSELDTLRSPNLAVLDSVMDYVNANLTRTLSLDDLAARANMSRSYFSTVFRRLNGMSPWDYITAKRIELSVQLLEQTDGTIIEIAGQCGFNSTANFNRAFRKITGRTPSSYRK
ncbi:MAG: helix-turn-helix domain-containing protein [Clostridia bacterium]|nr:helix-turn-helix domain-containing protein [Clostridia bacterium]